MNEYIIVVKTDQVVTKEIKVNIAAESEDEAKEVILRALETYPAEVTEPAISRMLTTKSHCWIPKSIEFLTVNEKNKRG